MNRSAKLFMRIACVATVAVTSVALMAFVQASTIGTKDMSPPVDHMKAVGALSGGGRCLSTPIENIEIVNDNTLKIQDRQGRMATLHLSGACLKDRNETVGLELSGGASSICHASDIMVVGGASTNIPLRCAVRSIGFDQR